MYSKCIVDILLVSVLSTITFASLNGIPRPKHIVELGRNNAHSSRKLTEISPLYPGYGTHFSYIYIGSPPQRQSVIIDTGSPYTGFPCSGCKSCGAHTDPYFEPKNSSSVIIQNCRGSSRCSVARNYGSGDGWNGDLMSDIMWIGGQNLDTVKNGANYKIRIDFGCMTSESGAFLQQLADGVLGLSMTNTTLPYLLYEKKITTTKIFALCFRIGGGIFTIGGVDPTLHLSPTVLNFAQLYPSKDDEWGIRISNIYLRDTKGKSFTLENPFVDKGQSSIINDMRHGGIIIDSAASDTYFPQSMTERFRRIFYAITGLDYSTNPIFITADQLNTIPEFVITIEAKDGTEFNVTMIWSNFLELTGEDRMYQFRIFFRKNMGTVLGENFMNGYNVIFDPDGQRMGFAQSTCKYEQFADRVTHSPSQKPTRSFENPKNGSDECKVRGIMQPLDECNAKCDLESPTHNYVAVGQQRWADKCTPPTDIESRDCHIACSIENGIVSAPISILCPEAPWLECSKTCKQAKIVKNPLKIGGECAKASQTVYRPCFTGKCPVERGDYLIFIDMKVVLPISTWSYVISENFENAFSSLFSIPVGAIDISNVLTYSSGNTELAYEKMQVQIRLQAKTYLTEADVTSAGENILSIVNDVSFADFFLEALNRTSTELDRLDYSRYGWMSRKHVVLINSLGFPVGGDRAHDSASEDSESSLKNDNYSQKKIDLLLAGVALGSLTVAIFLGYLYFRIRQEYFALSKEKTGVGLREMWTRFRAERNSAKRKTKYEPVRMTEMTETGGDLEFDTSLESEMGDSGNF